MQKNGIAFMLFVLFLFLPPVRSTECVDSFLTRFPGKAIDERTATGHETDGSTIPDCVAFWQSLSDQEISLSPSDFRGQEYLFHVIKSRRTVRKYKPTKVPREDIMRILDAARYAPTAGNQQPWKFLIIEDREKLDRLRQEAASWYLNRYIMEKKPSPDELEKAGNAVGVSLTNILSAPAFIAVLVDGTNAKYPQYLEYDGTLAAGYLMIAARALGYGTGFFVTFFPEKEMKSFLGIPDQYRLICFSPVGIPHEWPPTPPKKGLHEVVVFESF